MPAWVITALRLLAGGTAFGVGSELVAPSASELVGIGSGRQGPIDRGVGNLLPSFPGFVDPDHKHRRRRKRALTASDRADIAFIAGVISKTAAGQFAVVLAAR